VCGFCGTNHNNNNEFPSHNSSTKKKWRECFPLVLSSARNGHILLQSNGRFTTLTFCILIYHPLNCVTLLPIRAAVPFCRAALYRAAGIAFYVFQEWPMSRVNIFNRDRRNMILFCRNRLYSPKLVREQPKVNGRLSIDRE
jgi:hypothetical protein